jgi:hypothetical protein
MNEGRHGSSFRNGFDRQE